MKIETRAWNKTTKEWQTKNSGLSCNSDQLLLLPNGNYVVGNDAALTFTLFTGKVDKNGVKIFEGDLLKLDTQAISYLVVKYDEDLARFMLHGFNQKNQRTFRVGIAKFSKKAWVFGNIFENRFGGQVFEE